MKKYKGKLPAGTHNLVITSAEYVDDGRIRIVHQDLEGTYSEVSWTCPPANPRADRYFMGVLGYVPGELDETTLARIEGKVVSVRVVPGKNGFMNITSVYGPTEHGQPRSSDPKTTAQPDACEGTANPVFNSELPVKRRRTGGCLSRTERRKKGVTK